MTQEKANEIFNSDLGQQLDVIYVTSDDRAFIRHAEALKHTNGELDDNTLPLVDKSIVEWYPELIITVPPDEDLDDNGNYIGNDPDFLTN